MKNAVLPALAVIVALVATPAGATKPPATGPNQTFGCPDQPDKVARFWVEPGKRWYADNQCGRGTWLVIGWGTPDESDSSAEVVLVAPTTHFGPRKSGSIPAVGGWVNASLTTNPEFCNGETYVVWPNSKGVFDNVC